jgi:hypothetical protein
MQPSTIVGTGQVVATTRDRHVEREEHEDRDDRRPA